MYCLTLCLNSSEVWQDAFRQYIKVLNQGYLLFTYRSPLQLQLPVVSYSLHGGRRVAGGGHAVDQ